MKDFSAPYRQKVAHFGITLEEGRDERKLGDMDAWNILCQAVQKSPCDDIREEVKDALEWFEKRLIRKRPVKDFRKALEIVDSTQRYFALRDALKSLKQFMGY